VAATTHETTCLHCSLCCPAGVAIDEYGLVTPEYPGHTPDAHHGLCARGHFLADLAAHPGRIREVMERGGGGLRAVPRDQARGRSVLLRGSREGLAVVIDGNLPCEELARAVHVAHVGLNVSRVAIFVPPADEAVLRGLSTSAAPRVQKEALADCDILLAVGDPFATHPLVASPIIDAMGKARGNRLLCIDSVRGKTAAFAAEFCQVRPGGEAAALAGILRGIGAADRVAALADCDLAQAAQLAGADAAALEQLAKSVAGAKRLGVVLSLPEGRCAHAAEAAALAAKIAEAKGGSICPLLSYGNALGAWRLTSQLGAVPASQLMHDIRAGHVNRLIVVGTDVVAAIPMPELSSVEILAAVSAMPSATTARAQLVLPMALGFEVGGTIVDGSGVVQTLSAVEPPRGALCPAEALEWLCPECEAMPATGVAALAAAEPRTSVDEVVGAPAGWALAAEEGKLTIVSRADCLGFADGTTSRQLTWPAMIEPQPRVTLNPANSPAGGETFGWTAGAVTLRSDGVALTLPVEVSADVPPGVAAVSPNFPETRMLFAWAATGVGPGHATMETDSGND